MFQVEDHVTSERRWGWDGASLGYVSGISVDPIGFKSKDFNLYRYVGGNPVLQTDPSGLIVEVCCVPTDALGSAIGDAAAFVGIEHCWIRTSTQEAGMGPGPGLNPGSPIGGPTQITDHSGEGKKKGAHCHKVPGCSEKKVNKALVIGASTGNWGPTNNCNTFVQDVLANAGCHNKCLKWEFHHRGPSCELVMDCAKKQIPNLPLF